MKTLCYTLAMMLVFAGIILNGSQSAHANMHTDNMHTDGGKGQPR